MLLLSTFGAIGAARAQVTDSYGATIEGIAGRVSWWRLGETLGTSAFDQENTQTGTYIGGFIVGQPALPADTDNPAVSFDGIDGYVEIAHNVAHDLATGTLLIWFKVDGLATDLGIISKNASGLNDGDFFVWYAATDDTLRISFQSNGQGGAIISPGKLQVGANHCLLVCWGGGVPYDAWLATDGVLEFLGADASEPGTLAGNSQPILIGRTNNIGVDVFFAGIIDDVVLWNRRLEDAEIESATQATLPDTGTYEPIVTGLSPAVYLKFSETSGASFGDSSGNGRSATLNGSGAALGVTALATNVGSENTAIDLGDAGWLEIAHAAADTALTFPSAAPWTGGRKIADCTVSIWFKPNSLPTGSDKHVIVAKSSSQTPGVAASYDGSWEAYVDSNGAVHVECRSFRGRPCRIRTPNGAVFAGTTYHLAVQLAYDGVAAWLNGAKFEDGYANLLHVYGLAADIRDTVHANTFAWTIGKAAWGGQADLMVDEFAIYLLELTTADVQVLAQSGSVPPLAHSVWGALTVNGSSFATINAAITSVHASGGGTVELSAGTYNENVTLLSNVRIKGIGGTVTINGTVNTAPVTLGTLTDGTDDVFEGDRTFLINNSLSAGDVIQLRGTAGNPSPMRQDRRWNTESESNDPNIPDTECFEIESANATSVIFVGDGVYYDFAHSDRQDVRAWTPTKWVAIEDIAVSGSLASGSRGQVNLARSINCRLVNVTATTSGDGRAIQASESSLYCTFRNCMGICTDTTAATGNRSGCSAGPGTKDTVFKDCLGDAPKHNFAQVQNTVDALTTKCEFHGCGPGGTRIQNRGEFDAHGPSSGSVIWNCTAHRGFTISGWKNDIRWFVMGAGGTLGDIIINDGAGDSYYRDIFGTAPRSWFGTEEGFCGFDRNHLENVQHSAPPTGTGAEAHGLNYNTNTIINVDTPPPG